MSELRQYIESSRNTLIGLVMVVPLLILYNVGLLLTDWAPLNGADLVTSFLVEHLHRTGYLAVQGALLLGFVIAIAYLQSKRKFRLGYYLPLLAESVVYALTMGTAIIYVMRETHMLGGVVPESAGLLTVLTISAGAGVHEELVFRLGMIRSIQVAFAKLTERSEGLAAVVAVLVSSLLFSLAHYLGPEHFSLYTFIYRSLAGLVFAGLFLFRGLAVAVYTHALYDVYVLAFR